MNKLWAIGIGNGYCGKLSSGALVDGVAVHLRRKRELTMEAGRHVLVCQIILSNLSLLTASLGKFARAPKASRYRRTPPHHLATPYTILPSFLQDFSAGASLAVCCVTPDMVLVTG